MAAYTWTLERCDRCQSAQRTRGVHKSDRMSCLCGGRMKWEKVKYGKEKYVGASAGTVEKRPKEAVCDGGCGDDSCPVAKACGDNAANDRLMDQGY